MKLVELCERYCGNYDKKLNKNNSVLLPIALKLLVVSTPGRANQEVAAV